LQTFGTLASLIMTMITPSPVSASVPHTRLDDPVASGLHAVHQRLQQACLAAKRPITSVKLLAVSKTQVHSSVRAAYEAGQSAFGENYIQEALHKMDALRDLPLEWHCIGPIQSNKTKLVAERFDWVHSVDRLKIAQRLSEQRPPHLAPLQICLQLNIDGGANKSGVSAEEAAALALHTVALPNLCLRGIMTIPEPASSFAAQQTLHDRAYAAFAAIKMELARTFPPHTQYAERFDTLSLGMSNDLEAAVHAGSTLVRIGTAIFGAR
jgi:pyridoxal phosphate enzyme (YggS family)